MSFLFIYESTIALVCLLAARRLNRPCKLAWVSRLVWPISTSSRMFNTSSRGSLDIVPGNHVENCGGGADLMRETSLWVGSQSMMGVCSVPINVTDKQLSDGDRGYLYGNTVFQGLHQDIKQPSPSLLYNFNSNTKTAMKH